MLGHLETSSGRAQERPGDGYAEYDERARGHPVPLTVFSRSAVLSSVSRAPSACSGAMYRPVPRLARRAVFLGGAAAPTPYGEHRRARFAWADVGDLET